MKRYLLTVISLVSLVFAMTGQPGYCESGYLPFRSGVAFELTSYNQKGKMMSIVQHQIHEVIQGDDGFRASVEMQIKDAKGNTSQQGEYFIDCTEDGLLLDMRSLLNPESLTAFSTMQVEMSGDALTIPNKMEPGQELPAGKMQMKASLNGVPIITLSLNISNRKVLAKEKVTTPAGTFDCVKLTQTTTIDGFGSRTYEGVTWLAPGVGTVRTENYDKKGELDTYMELTSFTNH